MQQNLSKMTGMYSILMQNICVGILEMIDNILKQKYIYRSITLLFLCEIKLQNI